MRQGGDGYLALDVTDPSASSGRHGPYPKLQWELDDPAEPFGESWSEPILTRIKHGAPGGSGDHCGPDDRDGDCREQWVMIVGGGFRPESDPNLPGYVDPANPAWDADSKAIFVVALDSGQVLARLAHDPADPVLADMRFALPSTPAVLDLDFDGFADLIYVGDTGGQLWKWDVSEVGVDGNSDGLVDAASWPAGVFFRTAPEDLGGTLHYRSIFYPMTAAFVAGELTLSFATGERTDLGYTGVSGLDENNRIYVVRDDTPTGPGAIPSAPFSEADLTDITAVAIDPDLTDLGFYLTADDGEKFVTNHLITGGFLITTSYIPWDGSGGVCEAAGSAFVYIFDLEVGGGFFSSGGPVQGRRLFAGLGVPADPRITVSGGSAKLFVQTSTGALLSLDAPDPDATGVQRVYWRQDL